MHKLYYVFMGTVIFAPILFLFYFNHNLVCAPRAISSSAIFGLVPLLFLTAALLKKNQKFYTFTLMTLIIEVVITPVIMLKKLGWEKFINERLLAFFTFESIAIVQFIIVILLFKDFVKLQNN